MPVKTKKRSQSKKIDYSRFKQEQFKVYGHEALKKVKDLIKEGNVRRIIIKDEKGKIMVEIPVTMAVVGTVMAPILAGVGALAALVSRCTIVVEKKK